MRVQRLVSRVSLAVVCGIGVACGSPAPKLDVGPVSEADARTFTTKLLAAATPACDATKVESLIDEAALAARVFARGKSDELARGAAARTIEQRGSGGKILCAWLGSDPDATFTLLRVLDGSPIVRKLAASHGNASVTYFRLALGTTKRDGVVRLDDAYAFSAGMSISESLGETIDAAIGAGLSGARDFGKAAERARALRAEKKPLEAMAVLDGMPAEMRELRSIRMLRISTARDISPDRYRDELAALMKKYPDDPSLALLAVDEAGMRKDRAAQLAAIDIIDRQIGGDGFQEAIRSTVYFREGDVAAARTHADAAVRAEPGLARAQQSLLDAQAAQGDFRGAVATLGELATLHAPIAATTIAASPSYAAFAASPEFKAWAAEHP
jgi:hypothetical protein